MKEKFWDLKVFLTLYGMKVLSKPTIEMKEIFNFFGLLPSNVIYLHKKIVCEEGFQSKHWNQLIEERNFDFEEEKIRAAEMLLTETDFSKRRAALSLLDFFHRNESKIPGYEQDKLNSDW